MFFPFHDSQDNESEGIYPEEDAQCQLVGVTGTGKVHPVDKFIADDGQKDNMEQDIELGAEVYPENPAPDIRTDGIEHNTGAGKANIAHQDIPNTGVKKVFPGKIQVAVAQPADCDQSEGQKERQKYQVNDHVRHAGHSAPDPADIDKREQREEDHRIAEHGNHAEVHNVIIAGKPLDQWVGRGIDA